MSDDIVARLRHKYAGQLPICAEAADEIELLTEWQKNALLALDKREAEIGRLRADRDRWHDIANGLATHIEKASSNNARALQDYDNMVYKEIYGD